MNEVKREIIFAIQRIPDPSAETTAQHKLVLEKIAKIQDQGEKYNTENISRHAQLAKAIKELEQPKNYFEDKAEHDKKVISMLEQIPELKTMVSASLADHTKLLSSNVLAAIELQTELSKLMERQELTNAEIVKVMSVVEELKASKDAKKAFVGRRLEKGVT